MRLSLLLFLSIFLSLNFLVEEEKEYPRDYFQSPVDFPIRLSGTFGELRPNHFHAGIDIKAPGGKTGAKIFAVAEGTIVRVKVQSSGYGNAIYLKHPNGYTSVYAHLDRFPERVAQYVKTKQYEKQQFEVDLYPPSGKFNFEKGEVVGWLGLSGRSYGAHLHFEIRDTKSERPINPQLFGIASTDTRNPQLHQLRLYHLNDKHQSLEGNTYELTHDGNHNYRIKGDTLEVAAWRTGFALKAYDLINGVKNWNGIYSLEMFQNDEKIYGFKLESLSFAESRYLNAHIDYEEQKKNKSYFHRCFRLPGNRLSFYDDAVKEGVIDLYREKASHIKIVVKDVAGNSANLSFWVKRRTVERPKENPYNYHFAFDRANSVAEKNWKLEMKKGSLYEDLNWSAKMKPSIPDSYSKLFSLENEWVPIHRYFDLSLKPESLPEELRGKAIIARKDSKGKIHSSAGVWDGEFLKSRVRSLGDYSIMVDQKPPTLTPVSFKKDLRGASKMTFKATDDIDAEKNINSFSYRATIDGNWVLMEYDAKNDLLIHRFDERTEKGEHKLVITLTDAVGNITNWERTFVR